MCVFVFLFQATQKGDPVVLLKKQLDERERQLAAEQEDAAAAKNRLRELSKVRHITVSMVRKCTEVHRLPFTKSLCSILK